MRFDIIGHKRISFMISAAVFIAGAVSLLINGGFEMGIDFAGGMNMTVEIGQAYEVSDVEEIVLNVTGERGSVQRAGDLNDNSQTQVVIKTKELPTETRDQLISQLTEKYGLTQDSLLSTDNVGASISSELLSNAGKAVFWSMLAILLYITFRFELYFGLGVLSALIHDVLFMLSVYAITRIPVNDSFVAVVLTIMGYSINNTIIIYDRIRENLRGGVRNKEDINSLANRSIYQTLFRTMNTSITTLLTISMLLVLGIPSIREFALPLVMGILIGIYSSIFISSPIWTILRIRFGRSERRLKRA